MRVFIEDRIIEQEDVLEWSRQEFADQWKQDISNTIIDWHSDVAQLSIQTSGSTGVPKEIQLSKKSMLRSAEKTIQYFNLKPGMKAQLGLSAGFIAGKMMVIRALVGDMDLYCNKPSSTPIRGLKGRIDFAAMTPMQVMGTLEDEDSNIELIDQLIIGGAPVSPTLRNQLSSVSTRAYMTYGMTETITHIAIQQLNGMQASNVFSTLSGVSVSQEDGCLVIHADHIEDQNIITTDLVELIDQHTFKWIGRADNVINSGGIKLQPEAIEEKISALLTVAYVILAQDDPVLGSRAVLLIEAVEYKPEQLESINSEMFNLLNRYEIPKKIYFVEELVRTATGKIKRDINLYNLGRTLS